MNSGSLHETIIALMGATSGLQVVGGRYYHLRAPQGLGVRIPTPYIVIEVPTHRIPSTLRGSINLQNPIVRFHLFGSTYLQLNMLREVLVDMMTEQPLSAVYSFGTELYEDDTQLYHLVADFSVWVDR